MGNQTILEVSDIESLFPLATTTFFILTSDLLVLPALPFLFAVNSFLNSALT